MTRTLPGVALFVAALAASSCTAKKKPTGGWVAHAPMVIGHRGAHHLCAENTLECFQLAIDQGAQAFEADLQVLGDGTLVMFHDDNALDQTGVDRDLLDLTIADLGRLDAGYKFSADGGNTFPLRGRGLRVPTFAEFLRAFPDIPVLLDIKPETPEMAAALLRFVTGDLSDEARSRVYFKTNDAALADRLRSADPPLRVALTARDRLRLLFNADAIADLAPTWIDLTPFQLRPDVVAWARSRGHLITVSTVDDPTAMATLLNSYELDGMVTNRPDQLRALLTTRRHPVIGAAGR